MREEMLLRSPDGDVSSLKIDFKSDILHRTNQGAQSALASPDVLFGLPLFGDVDRGHQLRRPPLATSRGGVNIGQDQLAAFCQVPPNAGILSLVRGCGREFEQGWDILLGT